MLGSEGDNILAVELVKAALLNYVSQASVCTCDLPL